MQLKEAPVHSPGVTPQLMGTAESTGFMALHNAYHLSTKYKSL